MSRWTDPCGLHLPRWRQLFYRLADFDRDGSPRRHEPRNGDCSRTSEPRSRLRSNRRRSARATAAWPGALPRSTFDRGGSPRWHEPRTGDCSRTSELRSRLRSNRRRSARATAAWPGSGVHLAGDDYLPTRSRRAARSSAARSIVIVSGASPWRSEALTSPSVT
jgi:hypothetical protein